MNRSRAKRHLERWRRYEERCVKIGGDINPAGGKLLASANYYDRPWRESMRHIIREAMHRVRMQSITDGT